jgi:RNA polymerase sigma-70 factor (ECF subfamily)
MKKITKSQEAEHRIVLSAAHFDHQKALTQHSFFKLHDRALSGDLVQETFIKTWSYLAKGGKIDVMKAFLYHVLNNLIVDEYRKRKTVSLDLLLEKGFEPSTKVSGNIFDLMDAKDAAGLINKLSAKYQKVIRMRFIQDLSLAEMSLLTGQSKNAMAVQVHRGLDKLRELYDLSVPKTAIIK